MIKKKGIKIYTDSLARVATELFGDMLGLETRKRNYDAVIDSDGYDLTPAMGRSDYVVRLRVAGSSIDGTVSDEVLSLTRNACYAAMRQFNIPSSKVVIAGRPANIDIDKLRGELDLEASLDTPYEIKKSGSQ